MLLTLHLLSLEPRMPCSPCRGAGAKAGGGSTEEELPDVDGARGDERAATDSGWGEAWSAAAAARAAQRVAPRRRQLAARILLALHRLQARRRLPAFLMDTILPWVLLQLGEQGPQPTAGDADVEPAVLERVGRGLFGCGKCVNARGRKQGSRPPMLPLWMPLAHSALSLSPSAACAAAARQPVGALHAGGDRVWRGLPRARRPGRPASCTACWPLGCGGGGFCGETDARQASTRGWFGEARRFFRLCLFVRRHHHREAPLPFADTPQRAAVTAAGGLSWHEAAADAGHQPPGGAPSGEAGTAFSVACLGVSAFAVQLGLHQVCLGTAPELRGMPLVASAVGLLIHLLKAAWTRPLLRPLCRCRQILQSRRVLQSNRPRHMYCQGTALCAAPVVPRRAPLTPAWTCWQGWRLATAACPQPSACRMSSKPRFLLTTA
jgi:hypothetical protein